MSAQQRLLPFTEHHLERAPRTPLEELARRNLRLANLVEAISRRGDVRALRARLLLLLVARVCPLGVRPHRAWYEGGAVARMGVEGIRRAWAEEHGHDAPSERTIRAHLGALEIACAIQRAPGDFLPCRRDLEHPERRPRYGDTIHVLESEAAARFWAGEGEARLARNPEARTNPHRWKMLFGRWRAEAAQDELFGAEREIFDGAKPAEHAAASSERDCVVTATSGSGSTCLPRQAAEGEGLDVPDIGTSAPQRPRALGQNVGPTLLDGYASAAIVRLLRRAPRSPFAFIKALRECDVGLAGPMVNVLAGDHDRLLGASALLALALRRRGARVRNRAGWLVRQWRNAGFDEMRDALAAVSSQGNRRPEPPEGDPT